jgi:hypothetical protein
MRLTADHAKPLVFGGFFAATRSGRRATILVLALLSPHYLRAMQEPAQPREVAVSNLSPVASLSDAQLRSLAATALLELGAARPRESAAPVSSNALDVLSTIDNLPPDIVPVLVRAIPLVYGTPENRLINMSKDSTRALRQILTALGRTHSRTGVKALVGLAGVLSRSPESFLPAFELNLITHAIIQSGSAAAIPELQAKLARTAQPAKVFLEIALARLNAAHVTAGFADYAALVTPELVSDLQAPLRGEYLFPYGAQVSSEQGDARYVLSTAGGMETPWGIIPTTRAGLALFRANQLGLGGHAFILGSAVQALDSRDYATQRCAFAALFNAPDRLAVMSAMERYVEATKSENVQEYMRKLGPEPITPERDVVQ